MLEQPLIAIVGRPNVGKSSFFNAVLGKRVSIVDPVAGVTRDRVSAEVMHSGRLFELIDTGGIGLVDQTLLKEEIERQIEIALDLADVVIFVVDVREGVTVLDEDVAGRLRACRKPVLLVANKADSISLEAGRHQFHGLGFGEPHAVSALERRGVYTALEAALELIPAEDADRDQESEAADPEKIKVAVVGRMNAGKSSLVNRLAAEERVIVSSVPGTTRDSVDVSFRVAGRDFVIIDTAGIRRKRSIQDSVEFYGQARAERAVRRSDAVILMLDATQDISSVDKKIADLVLSSYKPCVLAISKWDLAKEHTTEEYGIYVADRLPGFSFVPLTFISSLSGFNVTSTFRLVADLCAQSTCRVSTPRINEVLKAAIARRAPQIRRSRLARIYFGTQVDVKPPTIIVFVNDIRNFNRDYRRYLANRFREELPFSEVPIKIAFRGKDRAGKPAGKTGSSD